MLMKYPTTNIHGYIQTGVQSVPLPTNMHDKIAKNDCEKSIIYGIKKLKKDKKVRNKLCIYEKINGLCMRINFLSRFKICGISFLL
jgi:hypothetical protein